MIIVRTPLRVGLLGGGTDYPEYFSKHGGGRTLVAAIDKYCTISVRWLPKFFDYRSRVAWSRIEYVKDNSEIRNPIVRECLRFLQIDDGVDVVYQGDLPARSGLGTSSAFAVGLLQALHVLRDGKHIGRSRLAKEAIIIERDYCHSVAGFQDQIACTFGGMSLISIAEDGDTTVMPCGGGNFLDCGEERLEELASRLMLFYTGTQRDASGVATTQMEQVEGKEKGYRRLAEMALDGLSVFEGGNLDHFGLLLEEGWQIKRKLAGGITSPHLDELHDKIIDAGARGCKIVGAGGGGFALAYVPKDKDRKLVESRSGLVEVPFQFDVGGSRIIWEG